MKKSEVCIESKLLVEAKAPTPEEVRYAFCDQKTAIELTGLSESTLYRERKAGRLGFSRIGGEKRGRVLYSLRDLLNLAAITKRMNS